MGTEWPARASTSAFPHPHQGRRSRRHLGRGGAAPTGRAPIAAPRGYRTARHPCKSPGTQTAPPCRQSPPPATWGATPSRGLGPRETAGGASRQRDSASARSCHRGTGAPIAPPARSGPLLPPPPPPGPPVSTRPLQHPPPPSGSAIPPRTPSPTGPPNALAASPPRVLLPPRVKRRIGQAGAARRPRMCVMARCTWHAIWSGDFERCTSGWPRRSALMPLKGRRPTGGCVGARRP